MKRLLLPLIAALALPTAVNAESYWLILTERDERSVKNRMIEMSSFDLCQKEGEKWKNSPTQGEESKYRTFICSINK